MNERIHVIELFDTTNGAIAQNNSITSDAIDLRNVGVNGFFSLHMIHTGGTITPTVLVCSTAAGTFVAPDTAVTIGTALAAGTHFIDFEVPLAPFIKIKFTETNTAATTSLTANLIVQ